MISEAKKLIVVIGMHRTGTSLITRGLRVLGVNLGDNLLPAMADVNAKGFWEDADINAFNIEMLHAINSEWDFLTPITEADIQELQQRGYFLKAVELLRNKTSLIRIFGLKDPRIAKLLPFWDQVFSHCNYDVNYLLTIRHPLSVVKSLQKRDGFVAEKAYLLWFTHVVTALMVADKEKLSIADYDFFMQHPTSELDRLAAEFKLSVDSKELDIFLNDFVDNDLRHTHYVLDDLLLDSACPDLVRDIYARLLGLAQGKGSLQDSDFLQHVDDWSRALIFGKTPFTIVDHLYSVNAEAKATINAYEHEIAQKQGFIENLERFTHERAMQVAELYQKLEVLNEERAVQVAGLYQKLEEFNQERVEQVAELDQKLEILNQERIDQVDALYKGTVERDVHIQYLDNRIVDLLQSNTDMEEELRLSYVQNRNLTEHNHSLVESNCSLTEQNLSLIEDIYSLNMQNQHLSAHVELITNSRSWKITRPLRFIMRLLKQGLSVEDKSQLLVRMRNINNKLPAVIQRTIRRLFGRWVRSMVTAPVSMVTADAFASEYLTPLPQVSLAQSSGKEFIVWGVIDWHFRHQRPQQIAQALAAEGDRVFYVSSNLVESDSTGFSIESLDQDGRLFQINLCVKTPTIIYHHAPSPAVVEQLLASLGELLVWAKAEKIINVVQHPFWFPVAQQLPHSQLVYDCMDHHEGFDNTGKEIIALEHALFSTADLTITTSGFLDDIVSKYTRHREIIRNAGEYEYFAKQPASVYKDAQGRKIIGYYGAIAEWFDIELIHMLAKRFSDCLILLVGADTVNAKAQLKALPNILFIGEVPYPQLTHYLYAFDVCLLPFKVIPLILATNPVKVYEYLGAGKPVVAVDVPEIKQFGDLVLVGRDHPEFVEQVGKVLAEPASEPAIAERKAFAEQQTWHHRAQAVSKAVARVEHQPKVSVIVVTYNNLDLTKQCLMSLDKYTDYSNMEIIVVDNASSDDSPAFLRDWAKEGANRILILNSDNKGFAAGNNQGLVAATGDYLVLLNNDTHVTPGWVASMVKHMQRNETIGLLGPVTGNIGNEAKIAIQYTNMDEMLEESYKFTRRHIGKLTPLRTAAFFCVMISRSAYEKVGLLDEAFGIGFFEDDDYCRRIEQAGFKIFCADDVFIHHHLSASFNKLKIEARQKLFEQNKVIYEKKWGPWIPHSYRPGVN